MNSIQKFRDTEVIVVETEENNFFLIFSLSTRKDTQIIKIEEYTGKLIYNGIYGEDLFSSQLEALSFLKKRCTRMKPLKRFKNVIGYITIGGFGFLLMVKESKTTMTLPGNHEIKTIYDTEWIKIPLLFKGFKLTTEEKKNVQLMLDHKIAGSHYYCETLDLTHQFPSLHRIENYEPNFVWNDFLAFEFQKIGMKNWCAIILQGFGEEKSISCDSVNGKTEYKIGLITRKSNLNPGARFFARGLNENHSPGNEWEVEFLCWKFESSNEQINMMDEKKDRKCRWSSYVFRRGTVPIHWKQVISKTKMKVQDPLIEISSKPFANHQKYYERLQKRYKNKEITVVNLLREGKHTENQLGVAYKESLQLLKKQMAIPINMINFNWLKKKKEDGIEESVKNYWNLVSQTLKDHGLTSGRLEFSKTGYPLLTNFQTFETQKGIIRINCADSLDRTNLISFYTCLQIIPQMILQLDDMQYKTKKNWSNLNKTLKEIEESYEPSILQSVAQLFLKFGDLAAKLFTKSKAMHTDSIKKYIKDLKKPQIEPKVMHNMGVLVKRRFENVLFDETRQKQIEIFLGINWNQHFKEYSKHEFAESLKLVSGENSYLVQEVPSFFSFNDKPENMLLTKNQEKIWFCKKENDFLEIDIFLPYYCQLYELSFVVRNGITKESSPYKMNVFVGTHLDDSIIAFQDELIPSCENKTRLNYIFPPFVSGNKEKSEIYDFHGLKSNTISRIRVVKIFFHRMHHQYQLTVGQIQLYGKQLSEPHHSKFNPNELNEEEKTKIAQLKRISFSHKKKFFKIQKGIEKEMQKSKLQENLVSLTSNIDEENRKGEDFVTKIIERKRKNSTSIIIPNTEGDSMSPFSALDSEKTKKYLNYIDQFTKKRTKINQKGNGKRKLSFNTSLKLELARIDLKISVSLRNLILINQGFKVSDYDPNYYVYFHDFEIEKQIRKEIKASQKGKCHNCKKKFFFSSVQCRYCRCSYCKNCASIKKYPIIEYKWTSNVYPVCKNCERIICRQQEIIQILKESKEYQTKLDIYDELFYKHSSFREFGFQNVSNIKNNTSGTISLFGNEKKRIKKEKESLENAEFLSEFPSCSILFSVPTDQFSPPIESILFPMGCSVGKHVYDGYFWKAPKGVKKVIIPIVLPTDATVSKLMLICDSEGYQEKDVPKLEIKMFQKLGAKDNSNTIRLTWNLKDQLTKNEEEDVNEITAKEELVLNIQDEGKEPTRIVQLVVTLEDYQVSNGGYLHLGRLLIFGKKNYLSRIEKTKDEPLLTSISEQKSYQALLKRLPIFCHTQLKTTLIFYKENCILDLILDNNNTSNTITNNAKGRKGNIQVSGFRVDVKHDSINGFKSQVRRIRVFKLTANKNKVLTSQTVIGTFVIPRVENMTSLTYEFEKNYSNVYAIRFQIASTYGAPVSIPKIFLHSTNFNGNYE